MQVELFRDRVYQYCRQAGFSFKALAARLDLNPSLLSRKFSGKNYGRLNNQEIKQIIRVLVEWNALNNRAEVLELLSLMGLSEQAFSPIEWQNPPLNQLSLTAPGPVNTTSPSRSVAPLLPPEPAVVSNPPFGQPNNLPPQFTSFVGRERLLEWLEKWLHNPNQALLTLVGTGGVGKTRLALEIGRRANEAAIFEDGIYLIELAELKDPTSLPSALLRVLNIQPEKEAKESEELERALHSRHCLLILDNFEHLLAVTPLVDQLRRVAPCLKILITSREPLNLYGETLMEVAPLSLPPLPTAHNFDELAQAEAVQLFRERTQSVKPDFELDRSNIALVSQICHYLEGLPLAIELAAGQLRSYPLSTLLTRLAQPLTACINGNGTRPARQADLQTTIEWSFNLLNEAEQRLFSRLALFGSGAEFETIEAVCNLEQTNPAELLQRLDNLVNKSLLWVIEGGLGRPRYTMLSILHKFAAKQLARQGEEAVLRKQQIAYYLPLIEQAELEIKRVQQDDWLNWLEQEQTNLSSLIEWLRQSERWEETLRLISALARFWWMHGYMQEAKTQFTQTFTILNLDKPQDLSVSISPTIQAKAFNAAGWLAQVESDYEKAVRLHELSLSISERQANKRGIATALTNLGLALTGLKHHDQARQALQQSFELYEELGDVSNANRVRMNLGIIEREEGHFDQAKLAFTRSLLTYQSLGDRHGEALALANLAKNSFCQTDYEQAKTALYAVVDLFHALHDKSNLERCEALLSEIEKLQV